MTGHELARLLLELPDENVQIHQDCPLSDVAEPELKEGWGGIRYIQLYVDCYCGSSI